MATTCSGCSTVSPPLVASGTVALTVAACIAIDIVLIALGVAGAGAMIQDSPVLLAAARWGGAAWVGATASGGWKTADAEAAGADAVFDYRAPDCAARILTASNGGVDRIVEVDVGGNVALWSEVIALSGSVIGYASRGGPMPAIPVSAVLMRKNVNLRGVVLNSAPAAARRQAMEEITAWLGGPARLHRIAARFPLAETAAAHEAVEAGTKRGTVVVLPQE